MLNSFRSALLAATILVASAAQSFAVGPISTTISVYPQAPTYSASILTLTPAASSTDVFTITGSATKGVYPISMGCTGVSTAAASQQVQLILRSTANSAGTSTAPTVAQYDSTAAAATATVAAYTANPTVGTQAGIVGAGLLQTVAPASAGVNGITFNFNQITAPQPLVLRGTTQVLSFSLGGVSAAAGTSLTCNVTWTEH
jgi:hypothetical protein